MFGTYHSRTVGAACFQPLLPKLLTRYKETQTLCAPLATEPIPTMQMGDAREVTALLGLGLIPIGLFPLVSVMLLPALGRCAAAGACSAVPAPVHSLEPQPGRLRQAVPTRSLLHGARSSLHFRLEAATNPTPASDSSSYSDRASSRSSAYTRRENRLAALSSRAEEESNRDYKKVGFSGGLLSMHAP